MSRDVGLRGIGLTLKGVDMSTKGIVFCNLTDSASMGDSKDIRRQKESR